MQVHRRDAARRLLATGLLLVAGLATVDVGSSARAAAGDLTVAAESGGTAVRGGQRVTLSAAVAAGSQIRKVTVLGRDTAGAVTSEQVDSATYGAPSSTSTDYVRVDGATLSGAVGLTCVFDDPASGCYREHPALRDIQFEIVLTTATLLSNRVDLDYVRPTVKGYDVITPTQIRVIFSEVVAHDNGDSAGDWTVTNEDGSTDLVLSVGAATANDCVYGPGDDARSGSTGCTRRLNLAQAVPTDTRPTVRYQPSTARNPGYRDRARNSVPAGDTSGAVGRAVDRVRPPVPSVQSVGGRTVQGGPPGAATGNAVRPAVVVGNVDVGNHAIVTVTSPSGRVTVAEKDVDANPVSVPLPEDLAEQGPYAVDVTVRDKATPEPNTSKQMEKGSSRADSPPGSDRAQYVLDSVRPVLSAARTDNTSVVVTLSEPTTPNGGQGIDWTIDTPAGGRRTVTTVSGSGDTRTLAVVGVPPGSSVRYATASGSTPYQDAAGNVLDGSAGVIVDGLPLPVVSRPAAAVVTAERPYAVQGTAAAGSLVQLWADSDNNGAPDSGAEPVAEQQLGAGQSSFTIAAPIAQDVTTSFVVSASDATRRSGFADVPAITQDSRDPSVSLTAPSGGVVRAGGSSLTVTWTAADANLESLAILELSVDGGSTWSELGPPRATSNGSSTSVNVTLPSVDSDAALVRVRVSDRAGHTASAVSGSFVIDATPPRITSAATGPGLRTVQVVFSEVVTGDGTSRGTDWTVAGSRATAATSSTVVIAERSVTVTTLTLSRDLGRNETPEVDYAPVVPPPAGTPLQDRASQQLRQAPTVARDGIAPAAPVITAPIAAMVTSGSEYPVSGTAEVGTVVIVSGVQSQNNGAATVGADGRWSSTATLSRDETNPLRAVSRDGGGNVSPQASGPTITQDSIAPTVTVDAPATGSRLEPGSTTTISWRSSDANPDNATGVYSSSDGGATFTQLASGQAASGSYTWTVPSMVTSKALVAVAVTDKAGHLTTARSGFLGIGTAAAASPTPTGSPTPGPGPAPVTTTPFGPVVDGVAVNIAINDATITAGNLPLLYGKVVDASGAPVSGRSVEIVEQVWGSRAYTTMATASALVTDAGGRWSVRVRPDRQRAYVAKVGRAPSPKLVVTVANRVNVASPTGGQVVSGRALTVRGDLDPDFASVPVGVALLRDRRFTYLTQGVTGRDGSYSIPVRDLPAGSYALVIYTSARLGTGAGSASRAVTVR